MEPVEQDAAPHLLVGGHRRHPGLHPLPAGRHLQLRVHRGRTRPRRAQLRGQGAGHPVPRAVRLRGRRRRSDPRDDGAGPAAAVPGGLAAAGDREAVGVLRRRGGRVRAARAGVVGRDVPGAAPRHLHHPGQDQAGQPAQRTPAARGGVVGHRRRTAGRLGVRLPVRAAGPGLEDGAAAPVPRHPARLVDRLGAPGGPRDLPEGRRGVGGRRGRRSGGAGRGAGGPGRARRAGRAQPVAVRARRTGRPAGRPDRLGRGAGTGRGPSGAGAAGRRGDRVRGRHRPPAGERGAARGGGRRRAAGLGTRQGGRPRGAVPRFPRQSAAAAPGPPQPVGRLGHRPALPAQAHRPDRRRVGRADRVRAAARDGPGGAGLR